MRRPSHLLALSSRVYPSADSFDLGTNVLLNRSTRLLLKLPKSQKFHLGRIDDISVLTKLPGDGMNRRTATWFALSFLVLITSGGRTHSSPEQKPAIGNIPAGMYTLVGEAS